MSETGQSLPLIMTASGPQPVPPITLLSALIASVAAQVPGYTADLPGSLIEDVSSTQVAGLAIADSARVEAVQSISPFGANPFILAELGQMFGIPIGGQTNTAVYLQFTGPSGYVVPQSLTCSDGTYTYTVVDGGIIGGTGTGQSALLFAVATVQGTWAVPAGTVINITSSLPPGIDGNLTVTNPGPGIPGIAQGETIGQYRARVFQAFLATSQGVTRYLKTLLGQVEGVQQRLISVRQNSGWEIIVGGGDPYQVAGAIFMSLFDLNDLVGSTMAVTAITKANPAKVTTVLNHGFATGQAGVLITGVVGMTEINSGGPYTITVVDEKNFTLNGIDSTGFTTYVSGGVVTPNSRNLTVNIYDPPDTYAIPIVLPPAQAVTIELSWNTDSPNFVSDTAIAQLGAPAIAAYVNSIAVGQPMNLFVLQSVFQEAISSLIDPSLLTVMGFTANINNVETDPVSGTGIINGDPESYFSCTDADIVITQA